MPTPRIRSYFDAKARILQPALTSHYECSFVIPLGPLGFIRGIIGGTELTDLLLLSCSEASLPGSQLATHELNNDFTGVTQRHAYRRMFDDRGDFTFYINREYTQLLVFERWIQYISGEQISTAADISSSYRMKFPEQYKTTIYITKFERDFEISPDFVVAGNQNRNAIEYSFFNAFPISIASMPVSYEQSQLLKCTVSFSYDRYSVRSLLADGDIGTQIVNQILFV